MLNYFFGKWFIEMYIYFAIVSLKVIPGSLESEYQDSIKCVCILLEELPMRENGESSG